MNGGVILDLRAKIREIEGFPIEGVSFKDVTTLTKDKDAFKVTVDKIIENLQGKDIDYIVGPEARGFLFGAATAYGLGAGFIPIRKPGKLPSETAKIEYELEYGKNTLEIHNDALKKGDRVAIVDDLLATGGTVLAAAKLVESLGAEVVSMEFLIELEDLNGREKLQNYNVDSLIKYE